MSGALWLPGAERVKGAQSGGTMLGGPPRMVHHITWDRLNPRPSFNAVRDYLSGKYDPHLMVDPFTGRIAQFLPANRSAYALSNKRGGVETNRQGSVCLQVEWYFSPGLVVNGKRYDHLTQTPMRGWDEIVEWADDWGIPRRWPLGMPNWRSARDTQTWMRVGGHYGHSQVPENTHTDGGPLPAFKRIPAFPVSEEDDMAAYLFRDDRTGNVYLREGGDTIHLSGPGAEAYIKAGFKVVGDLPPGDVDQLLEAAKQ